LGLPDLAFSPYAVMPLICCVGAPDHSSEGEGPASGVVADRIAAS
jgi:hypothetical protein